MRSVLVWRCIAALLLLLFMKGGVVLLGRKIFARLDFSKSDTSGTNDTYATCFVNPAQRPNLLGILLGENCTCSLSCIGQCLTRSVLCNFGLHVPMAANKTKST